MIRPLAVTLQILLATTLLLAFAQRPQKYVTQGKSDPVKLTYLQQGVIKLQSRTAQANINIREHLYGCMNLYDGSDPKSRPSKTDTISIRVLDEVIKGDKFFLLLQITTGSGCNVQGMCGAGEESGLYWFQFNSALKQEKFQKELISSCRQDIEITEGAGKQSDETGFKLETRNGKLALKYTRFVFGQNRTEKYFTLAYDRATPEQGFIVKETGK